MKIDKTNLIGVSSLLVHAAKIDENYTENEKTYRKIYFNYL